MVLGLCCTLGSGFRFAGGEGAGRPDFLGEAGLMNAVPRIGKRGPVPRMGKRIGNPFDSRFRFRFNNW